MSENVRSPSSVAGSLCSAIEVVGEATPLRRSRSWRNTSPAWCNPISVLLQTGAASRDRASELGASVERTRSAEREAMTITDYKAYSRW
jgi:hypothetical protein